MTVIKGVRQLCNMPFEVSTTLEGPKHQQSADVAAAI